jgi:magnesium-transporting ATPase (P-type)
MQRQVVFEPQLTLEQPFNIGFWIYLIYAAAVKLACLFFYRTIFLTSHKTLIFVNTGIVVVSLVYTTIFFLQIFRCRPIEMVWDWKVDGTCRKSGVEAYSSGVVNAVTDIYVLIVPIPAVWALPLNRCRRIRVISVFCLGLA